MSRVFTLPVAYFARILDFHSSVHQSALRLNSRTQVTDPDLAKASLRVCYMQLQAELHASNQPMHIYGKVVVVCMLSMIQYSLN